MSAYSIVAPILVVAALSIGLATLIAIANDSGSRRAGRLGIAIVATLLAIVSIAADGAAVALIAAAGATSIGWLVAASPAARAGIAGRGVALHSLAVVSLDSVAFPLAIGAAPIAPIALAASGFLRARLFPFNGFARDVGAAGGSTMALTTLGAIVGIAFIARAQGQEPAIGAAMLALATISAVLAGFGAILTRRARVAFDILSANDLAHAVAAIALASPLGSIVGVTHAAFVALARVALAAQAGEGAGTRVTRPRAGFAAATYWLGAGSALGIVPSAPGVTRWLVYLALALENQWIVLIALAAGATLSFASAWRRLADVVPGERDRVRDVWTVARGAPATVILALGPFAVIAAIGGYLAPAMRALPSAPSFSFDADVLFDLPGALALAIAVGVAIAGAGLNLGQAVSQPRRVLTRWRRRRGPWRAAPRNLALHGLPWRIGIGLVAEPSAYVLAFLAARGPGDIVAMTIVAAAVLALATIG